MSSLLTFDEACRRVLDAIAVCPPESVATGAALGRTLAAPVDSPETLPAFDNSAMDGFAVRAADAARVPVALEVVETLLAGDVPRRALAPGTCAEIMTGAPLPPGADAIVPVEATERVDRDTVRILEAAEAGRYVRPAGGDVGRGDRLFDAGTLVTPAVVGLAALAGVATLPVRAVPRVAVVATGDEVAPAGAACGPGQIHDANGPGLAAQVAWAGGVASSVLHARDTPEALRAALDRARTADVVVLAGGVSAGRHDWVRQVLRDAGAETLVAGVRQRPGKPFTFARLDGRPVFALPGNPTSAAVCFEAYVRPALARMLGRPAAVRLPAVLDAFVAKSPGLHHLVRGCARVGTDGRLHVTPSGPQGSGFYVPFVRATCLIHLPEASADLPPGAHVEIEMLPWATLGVAP